MNYLRDIDKEADPTALPSHWVAVARDEATLNALKLGDNWQPLDLSDQRQWRDDFSNLVGIILWRGALRDSESH